MKIHFIGIGGIGVSALAQYYLHKGHKISGSDLAPSEITDAMAKRGARILVGNNRSHIQKDFDLVIHSPAVKPQNPEYAAAKDLGIQLQSYPEALGQLTREYQTIAVSGSHGKSTTTSMLALVLIKAGIDPTVIVGTKLKEFGDSNFRAGNSKYLVIEACEYDGSFLNYQPQIAVITNIDKEHLDYFKTFANVVKAFKSFIMRLPKDGFLVINKDDEGNARLKIQESKLPFKVQNYSLQQSEAGKIKKILKVPGKHNISNALAVLAATRILGVKDTITLKALAEFKGTWRRFEVKKGKAGKKSITVVSDYGHHPTEVMATLIAAREKYPYKKIWCIFQPHQYQRTYYLFNDFVKLFKKVPIDSIIITDIYDVAGREEKNINQKVNSELLVKKILAPLSLGEVGGKQNVKYMAIDNAEEFIKENIKGGEVLIIMGAGDIYKLVDKF